MKIFHSPVWNVAGLPFHELTIQQTAELLLSYIEQRERCFLSTPNLNFTASAQYDEEFFESVIQSDLVVVDGVSLLVTAKLLRTPFPERVAGSDVFAFLSNTPRENKIKVFFFGGETGVAERAHQRLNESSQGMRSCGFFEPGMGSVEEMSSDEIITLINESEADFLVVALGAKKGQQWIMRNLERLNIPVVSHLGAVINFVAGTVERAPLKWQKYGLEWLWRIRQEPKLIKRYFRDAVTYANLFVTQIQPLLWFSKRLKSKALSRERPSGLDLKSGHELVLTMSGCMESEIWPQLDEILELIVLDADKRPVIIDGSALDWIGGDIVGRMLLLSGQLKKQGRDLKLRSFSDDVQRLLRYGGVLRRFQLTS
ncbi:WecB/TagA/CpsF family glycosyltransferase [Methylophaga lonarensis]|uniref:WecB/TagA/CpsF family glycosyltransferase n=1 Tax=Methylophaga lonarensis TaxID=999151 RepID=UPI003D29ACDE